MRTFIVSGHSSGIGFAVTQQLLSNNVHVIGLARRSIEPQEGLVQFNIDLSALDQLEALLKQLVKEHNISGVVACAGSGSIGSIENFSKDQIMQSVTLNLTAPLVLARFILPVLKKRERSDLIFIGSESALKGARYGSLYSAAKFGLRGAAQALRDECATANCHVGIVHPGLVRSPFFDNLDFEPGENKSNAVETIDVATAVMAMINAPDNAVIEEVTVKPLKHVVRKKSTQK